MASRSSGDSGLAIMFEIRSNLRGGRDARLAIIRQTTGSYCRREANDHRALGISRPGCLP